MTDTVFWPNGSRSDVVPPRPGVASSGFRASSEYGWRIHPITGIRTLHAGIDLIGWTTIVSPVDGIVTYAGWNGGYGNLVEVTRANGDTFRMAHNRSIDVFRGQRVSALQRLAIMGTTGNSTGVHSHFETRPGGGATINPRDYMARQPIPGPAGGGNTTPPTTPKPEEAIDMNSGVYYENGKNTLVYLVFNTDSGWFHEFGNGPGNGPMPGDYNNALARALGTPSWAKVTKGHADVIKRGLSAVQPKSIPSELSVALDTADVAVAAGLST
ncbi:endolysin [Microbacterium phage Cressida]|uniref:Endolysin n=1 Tax=Microbacterium phage Cressida TaxID=2591216 RepID=A0A514DI35_9CAUD|nr:endolysin [Microbacterium phage Cressida]QDH93282.1 endolysin [Microbacterium phage Cressida]